MYTSALERHAPLYEIKANLFKALAHPIRIRILELLTRAPETEVQVGDLIAELGMEPSHVSQHLSVLRRHRVVHSIRRGSAVFYRVAHPRIVDLLMVARDFLYDNLDEAQRQRAATADLPSLGGAR